MNRVFLVGNITGDIYFDVLNGRPFLRLILTADKPWVTQGLRIMLNNDHDKAFCHNLKKGSEVGVIGHLAARHYKGRIAIEIEAVHVFLFRNRDWDAGNLETNQQLP
ncbi:MAG: single-stranded DNA-binding protein [Anaerolineales bacterium]